MIRSTRSNALRWAVPAPRGTVYLTGLQWQLWWLLSRPRRHWLRGDVTLSKLSLLTGSSRGRCWHAMTRLRSLELVSWRAFPVMERDPDRRPRRYSPGCRGRLLVWIPRAAKNARARGGLRPLGATRNDSVSGTFGAWITREGLAASLQRRIGAGWRPGGASSSSGGNGTRPWKGPPRVVWSRCPAGHRLTVGRRSWALGPSWAPSISVRFEGDCPTCRASVVESIQVAAAPPLPRGLTAAELRDPGLLATRIDSARLEAARAGLHPAIREQLRRDYTERPPGYIGRWPAPDAWDRAGELVGRILPATIGSSPAATRRGVSKPLPGSMTEGSDLGTSSAGSGADDL